MRVLSWNVEGLAPKALRKFLEQINDEVDWDFLLLQECGKFKESKGMDQIGGHKVICSAAKQGEKPRAIIVHSNWVPAVIEESVGDFPRTLHVDIKLEKGKKLRLISSHLEAGHSLEAYEVSLAQLESALPAAPGQMVIVGLDGQDRVGPRMPWDLPLIGDFAEEPRGQKGELLVRFAHLHSLLFANTQAVDPLGTYTCHYNLKSEPKQIDYFLVPGASGPKCQASVLESTATVSDHRPLYLVWEMDKYKEEFCESEVIYKPIGWKRSCAEYQENVLEALGANPADDFPMVPLESDIDKFTKVVASVAKVSGSPPKGGRRKLPPDHEFAVELSGLVSQRSAENNPLQRQVLSKAILKARRRV